MRYPERLARVNRYVTNPLLRPVARHVPPWAVVHHVGRTTGREYTAPVVAFPDGHGFLIPMAYGNDRDWVKNVIAAGSFELERRGQRLVVSDPTLHPGDELRGINPNVARVLRAVDLEGVLTVRSSAAS